MARTISKEITEYLLSAGFSANYIVENFNAPKTNIYRWKKELENDQYSLYNLTQKEDKERIRKDLTAKLKKGIDALDESTESSLTELIQMYKHLLFLSEGNEIFTTIKVLSDFADYIKRDIEYSELYFFNRSMANYIATKLTEKAPMTPNSQKKR